MGTNNIVIKNFNSIEEAPIYNLPKHRYAELEEVCIVRKGTVNGNATLDLIFADEDGQKYVAQVTANLIKTALAAV